MCFGTVGNVETISKALSDHKDDIENHINWIGHWKPEYKTNLNYEHLSKVASSRNQSIALYVNLNVAAQQQQQGETSKLLAQQLSQEYTSLKALRVTVVSPSRLLVNVKPEYAHQVIQYLKDKEVVHWIERKFKAVPLNDVASQIVQQSGVDSIVSPQGSPAERKPLWAKGLTGKGEVIGVADSGIDWDHCFFHDPKVPMQFNKVNMDHRKIIGYYILEANNEGEIVRGDDKDEINGHGTHVAGSIAGNMFTGAENYQDISRFAGVAKDAKLFFQDMVGTDFGGYIVPDNFEELFSVGQKEAGVRIHSNSWGFGSPMQCSYDCRCVLVSEYDELGNVGDAVDNDKCMKVFGRRCCEFLNRYDSLAVDVDTYLSKPENDEMLILFAAGNDGTWSATGTIISPSTAKNCLTVGASQTTSVNFIEAVDYEDLTPRLQSQGLKSVEECCAAPNPYLRAYCCPEAIKVKYSNSTLYNLDSMAAFSARGPTFDGRIKPDIVAPGNKVISAHSDGDTTTKQCGLGRPDQKNAAALLTMQGTSMATPVMAGSAALVRQYYRERRHMPNPSGPLLKATLIHSGQHLPGTLIADGNNFVVPLPVSEPNFNSGFGLVSLGKVLMFSDSKFKLFTFDRKVINRNSEHTYCFRNKQANSPFKATITWYDPPASPTARILLVNDLDLDVTYYTNGGTNRTRAPGNNNFEGDRLNNVEQSTIASVPKNNIIQVRVSAVRISQGDSQTYALVVTGSVEYIGDCKITSSAGSEGRGSVSFLLVITLVISVLVCTIF